MPDEPIRAKVAQILNQRELVLNRGASDGVSRGMRFAVLNPRGQRIVDPDTGKPIGSVDIPKVLVEAVRVDENVTVARTFRARRVNRGGSGVGLGSLFDPPKWENVPETLRLDESADLVELDPSESVVKIGDPAVQTAGDEFLP